MPITEIAYAEKSATEAGIEGNGLAVIPIDFDTGQECFVPMYSRPVYLHASAILVADSPTTTESLELAIIRSDIISGGLVALDDVEVSAHGNPLASGERLNCFKRIPPFTSGRKYQLAATITAGNFTVLSPSHSVAFLLAYI